MKTILALLLLTTPTLADHCRIVRNKAVVIKSTGAVITPYAIPVAVPVQLATPYAYQHAGAQVYQQQARSADAQLFEEFLTWKKSREAQASHVTPQALPQTMFSQHCIKCHTNNADAREHLDTSRPLTADEKIAASRALLKGTMPKGRKIDDATRGNLLGELLGVDGRSPYIPGTDANNEAAPARSEQPTPAAATTEEAPPPPPPQPELNQQSQPQP